MRAIFSPRSVVFVGASPNAGSITGQPLRHLLDRGYAGTMIPVTERHTEIAGLACVPRVEDVPRGCDLAVIVIAAQRVPEVVAALGTRGVKAAIVISSGFAEAGPEGQALQRRLLAAVRAHGIRVIGPNCQGMFDVSANLCAGFGPVLSADYGLQPGGVSFVTQSGGFGYGLVSLLATEGIGFRRIASVGNEADLGSNDFIEHFVEDEGTRVIAAYLEGLRDGRRLAALARRALALDKPLLVWKAGRTQTGRRAAASHTGSLAGDAAVCSAVLRQHGVIEVGDVGEMADVARAFLRGKRPRGNRVAVFSASGGAGVLISDECDAAGLVVPPLDEDCRARLAGVAPALGSLQNPVDVMGGIFDDPVRLEAALRVLVEAPDVDALVVIAPLRRGERALAVAQAVAEVDAATDKPVFVSWAARRDFAGQAHAHLRERGVPCFDTPVRCARALAALVRHAEVRRRTPVASAGSGPAAAAIGVAAGGPAGSTIPEHEAKRLLSAYGIPVTREQLATGPLQAERIACDIGFPVAIKVQSPQIAHKTEAGGIRLGIADPEAARTACAELLAEVRRRRPDARIDGVLVQEMVQGGIETIVGVVDDASFGPVLMFGSGGVDAEVHGDVAFRLPPIDLDEAHRMIAQTRIGRVLAGTRGRAPADIAALADVLVKAGRMALDLTPGIAEIDVNPLAVLPRGRGVVALDAVMVRGAAPDPDSEPPPSSP